MSQAGNAIAALKKGLSLHSSCRRQSTGSDFKELATNELVPGDIVHLASGDAVPRDSLILTTHEEIEVNPSLALP